MITYEMAERVAGYYCEARALEDDNASEEEMDALNEEWPLTEAEEELLTYVLESGLCDYFSADDVMSVLKCDKDT